MICCETCRIWTGQNVCHTECPIRANFVCRRCCGSGHTTAECRQGLTLLPLSMEELIAPDLRETFGINTFTPLSAPSTPLAGHDVNRVDIINQDKWIREFMKHKHLATARKREDNLARIMDWAAGCGLNVRILNQEP